MLNGRRSAMYSRHASITAIAVPVSEGNLDALWYNCAHAVLAVRHDLRRRSRRVNRPHCRCWYHFDWSSLCSDSFQGSPLHKNYTASRPETLDVSLSVTGIASRKAAW